MKTSLILLLLLCSPYAHAQKEPTRDQIDEQMIEFNRKMNEDRGVAVMRGGQVVGYKKLGNSAKNENYEKLPMQEGQVIHSINGVKVDNVAVKP